MIFNRRHNQQPYTGGTFVNNTVPAGRGALLLQLQRLWIKLQYYISRATANSAAAVIIWLVGAWSSGTFLTQIGIEGPTKLYAFILQALLTVCEGPIWYAQMRVNRGGATLIAIGALIVDVIMNVGGLWIYLQNLGATTFWQAVMAATQQTNPPAGLTTFGIALLCGLAIAAGPEALWDL